MTEIATLDPIGNEEWDKFVFLHPLGWLYHTSAWAQILTRSFDHIKPQYLSLINTNTGKIIAALPLCQVTSWITGNRLVALPYATLYDPLVDTCDQFNRLLRSALNLLGDIRSTHIEIRVFKSRHLLDSCTQIPQSNYKLNYLRLDQTETQLMRGVKRTVRQSIRRAEKAKLDVYEGTTEEDLKVFYNLYLKTRKRLALPPQPYRFIYALWHTLHHKGFLTLLMARHKNSNIAGAILLKYKDRASLEYLASDNNYFSFRPNHLLVWSCIKLAKEEGYEVFDLGRTQANNLDLLRFKNSWGTAQADLFHFFHPDGVQGSAVDQSSVKRKFVQALCKKLPYPVYHVFGNFVYRHLG